MNTRVRVLTVGLSTLQDPRGSLNPWPRDNKPPFCLAASQITAEAAGGLKTSRPLKQKGDQTAPTLHHNSRHKQT